MVKRAQVGIHLLLQIAGQKAELFAGLNRGAREDDAADLLRAERRDRHCDGEIRLACSGRAHADRDRILPEGID